MLLWSQLYSFWGIVLAGGVITPNIHFMMNTDFRDFLNRVFSLRCDRTLGEVVPINVEMKEFYYLKS
jgi:hypothetical protein